MRKRLPRASAYLKKHKIHLDVFRNGDGSYSLNDPAYIFQHERQYTSLQAAMDGALNGQRPVGLILIDPFEISLN
jgi:hypothetical protein